MFKLAVVALSATTATLCNAADLQSASGGALVEDQAIGDALNTVPEDAVSGPTSFFRSLLSYGHRKGSKRGGKRAGKKGGAKNHKKRGGNKPRAPKRGRGRQPAAKGRRGKKGGRGRKHAGNKGRRNNSTNDSKSSGNGHSVSNTHSNKSGGKKSGTHEPVVSVKHIADVRTDYPMPSIKPSKHYYGSPAASSAACVGTAYAGAYADARHVEVDAVSKAIAHGCANDGHILADSGVYSYAESVASFAVTLTQTFTHCKTSGHAEACAAAESYAKAYAEGFATATADAYASAEVSKECGSCLSVSAEAFIGAIDFYKIFSQAESWAKSAVCTRGNEEAAAYEECLAESIGVAFTDAFAYAFIESYDCYEDSAAKAEAWADFRTGYFHERLHVCQSQTDLQTIALA